MFFNTLVFIGYALTLRYVWSKDVQIEIEQAKKEMELAKIEAQKHKEELEKIKKEFEEFKKSLEGRLNDHK